MQRYDGILLDLFGTLVLAEPERLPALRIGATTVRTTLGALADLLALYAPGVGAGTFWHALAGVNEEMIQRRQREHVEEPARERFRRALARVGCDAEACREGGAALARAHHRALAEATVLPPAHAVLVDELRARHRLAVVSNFDDTAAVFEILHRHGMLAKVDAIVVSESLGLRKPHPLMVQTALRMLEVPASAALLVGDTFGEDVAAAHAAGVDAAWLDREARNVPPGATPPRFILRALPELRDALG
jgi:putative hydrolase of the HAD superfamily